MQSGGYTNGLHHILETDNHDMEEVKGVSHAVGQVLVREKLDRNVDHPVTECL